MSKVESDDFSRKVRLLMNFIRHEIKETGKQGRRWEAKKELTPHLSKKIAHYAKKKLSQGSSSDEVVLSIANFISRAKNSPHKKRYYSASRTKIASKTQKIAKKYL